MGRELSLFADYTSKENRITNYCGLILKILYGENLDAFEEAINKLVKGNKSIKVSPIFTQQEKQAKSVPDLCINQRSFSIFFETKINDWFYTEQIDNHLQGLNNQNSDVNILFLLSNFETDNYETRFETERKIAEKYNVILQPVSFEDFFEALNLGNLNISNTFVDMRNEFKTYLDRVGLLPTWKSLLDIVNCGSTTNEINNGMYACPNSGGCYSHNRAQYFGAYSLKAVNSISEIRSIVIVHMGGNTGEMKWKNTNESDKELIEEALQKLKQCEQWRLDEVQRYDLQVFLLGERYPTNFRKDSKGGMMGSKQYFWNIPKDVTNAKMLAEFLNGKAWEDFK
ncbi:MAG: hypothetical protein CVU87_12515 [Firmicutes bacterium HGW-Firmicutes-12]|nr:MAG: hypothetical protein CVU87_12515 [Firmicutes bacterium HGW-Firmicutes-12]